jgi:hypothetical protein
MFEENKYSKWYDNIIKHAKRRAILRSYFDGEYHHIIPKSLGGTDDKQNIVKLTYREHFVCHLLLTKMCKDKSQKAKMCWALHRLTFSRNYFGSYQYEITRKVHIKNFTENHPSKRFSNWGDKMSKIIEESWKEDEIRRENMKRRMGQWRIENPEKSKQISINNLPKPMFGKDNPVSKRIEYKGNFYYGWRELMEQTGVSKHIYEKYYLNNIPFEHRIGSNGPEKKLP